MSERLKPTISAHQMLEKNYPTVGISEEWQQYIGDVEKGFKMLVWGHPKQGKTTFVLTLCKYLSSLGKVYYNSIEQGEGKSLQKALELVKIHECEKGSFVIGNRDSYSEMMQRLRTNRSHFIVIDSLDYLNLTTAQYKQLEARYGKNKAIIIISWEGAGGKPKSQHAKNIRYMVDITVHVHAGVAKAESRFGATEPYHIFGRQKPKAGQQLHLQIA